MSLRCTTRLLAHYSERPTAVALAVESEPLLGEWYANLIRHGDTDNALCVNEVRPMRLSFCLNEHRPSRFCEFHAHAGSDP